MKKILEIISPFLKETPVQKNRFCSEYKKKINSFLFFSSQQGHPTSREIPRGLPENEVPQLPPQGLVQQRTADFYAAAAARSDASSIPPPPPPPPTSATTPRATIYAVPLSRIPTSRNDQQPQQPQAALYLTSDTVAQDEPQIFQHKDFQHAIESSGWDTQYTGSLH